MTPRLFDFEPLFAELSSLGFEEWAAALRIQCSDAVAPQTHGMLEEWKNCWDSLPATSGVLDATDGFDLSGELSSDVQTQLSNTLQQLHPWRKGPFQVHGSYIDTEWHSDWKWDRLKNDVELRDRFVLDVGCGNGYYGWRMLAAGAKCVLGLDPFLLYVMQHEAIKKLVGGNPHNFVLPLGDTCLPPNLPAFDTTFSMGVLYHRPNPISHLQHLCGSLKPGGQLVLETLVVEGDRHSVLVPERRYAKMRNVWFIPSVEMLELWLRRTGFVDIRVVDVTKTSTKEQRSTDWMTFESLPDFLRDDESQTIEGHPPPIRAVLVANRR